MDSKENIQMIMNTLISTQATLNALNERSKNYYDLLASQKKDIEDNKKQLKEDGNRIEKLEIAIANLDIIKDHQLKIETMEIDISNLKRDRWWIGSITGVVTGLLSSTTVVIISLLLHRLIGG